MFDKVSRVLQFAVKFRNLHERAVVVAQHLRNSESKEKVIHYKFTLTENA